MLFVAALIAACTMNAQTIAIDGDNADWAAIPMLNDPGASPIFKMVVPQSGLTLPDDAAICVMVQRTVAAEKTTYPGAPVVYVDADKKAATTDGADAWYCPSFGPDYEMGAWDGNSGAASDDEMINEVLIVKSTFTGIPFDGSCNTWMLFNWNKLLPNSPTDNVDSESQWKWGENSYHPLMIKPFAFANLEGAHNAASVYSSHEALTIGSNIDMGGNSVNDVEFWASWAVELTNPAKYAIKADISSTNTASVDLKLINVATNQVAASFASEDLSEGAAVEVGEWDLSAVPAGKYMLRFSNHVEWSAMKLNSLTLSVSGSTAVETIQSDVKAVKVIRDGQVFILRNGRTFTTTGTEVK